MDSWLRTIRHPTVVTALVCAAGVLVAFDDIGPLRRLAGTFGASLAWIPLLLCGLLLPRRPGRRRWQVPVALWSLGAVVTALTFLVLPTVTRGVNLFGKAVAVGVPIAVFLAIMAIAARLAEHRPSLVTVFGLVSLGTLVLFLALDLVGVLPRTGEWLLHGLPNENMRARGSRYEASVLGAGVLVALGTAALCVRTTRWALAACAAALGLALLVPSRGTLVAGLVFGASVLVAIVVRRGVPRFGFAGVLVVLTLAGGFALGPLISLFQGSGLTYSTSDAVRSVWADVALDVALDHPVGMGYAAPLHWLPEYVRASMREYSDQFAPSDFAELDEQLDADGSFGFSPKTMPGLVGVYFGAVGVLLLLAMWTAIGRRSADAWRGGAVMVAPAAIVLCLIASTYFSSIYAWEQAFLLGALLGVRDSQRSESETR